MRKLGWAVAGAGAAVAGVAVAGMVRLRREGGEVGIRPARASRHVVRQAIRIEADPQAVYDLWRDPGAHARIRELEVTAVADGRWHWRRTRGDGPAAEWETVFTREEPPTAVAWRSENAGGKLGVFHEGVLHIAPVPGGGCEMRLTLELTLAQNIPGVRLDLAKGVARALRRFRQLAETGEIATTAGQPAYGREQAVVEEAA